MQKKEEYILVGKIGVTLEDETLHPVSCIIEKYNDYNKALEKAKELVESEKQESVDIFVKHTGVAQTKRVVIAHYMRSFYGND